MKRLLFTILTLAFAGAAFAQTGNSYDTPPAFKGNVEGDFHKWVYDQRIPPKDSGRKNLKMVIMAFEFIVDETGQVTKVKTIETNQEKYSDRMADVIKNSPLWDPATLGGKPVSATQTLKLTLWRTSFLKSMTVLTPSTTPALFVDAADESQNMRSFGEWVSENLGFPGMAKNIGVNRSRVVVQATIDRFGNIVNPEVITSSARSLSRRAEKTLEKSPKWEPAKDASGEATDIKVEFELIFRFARKNS
jgi:Gram-negative bacterial tonB protein.